MKKKKAVKQAQHPKTLPKQPAHQKRNWFGAIRIILATILVLTGSLFVYSKRSYFRGQASTTFGSYKDFNVLLITIDTLRADHLPLYGYKHVKTPEIDRFAEQCFIFEDVFAQVPITLPSHASILTGLLPNYHGVRENSLYVLDSRLKTIAEILKEKGYRTAAFVSSFALDSEFKIDQGFDLFFDEFESSEFETDLTRLQRRGGETETHVENWLSENKDRKFFLWAHYYDPHDPYDPPEPYRTQYASQPYDGEIAYTDGILGRLFARLEEFNLEERTIIILTSDHGEGLGEHKEETHGIFLYDSTLHVPLLIRLPGGKMQRIPNLVRQLDIMPTILEWLGLKPDPGIHGRSLIPLMEGKEKEERFAYSESYYCEIHYGWSSLHSLVSKDYKFIQAPSPELYSRKMDPLENQNLISQDKAVAGLLQKQLQELLESYSQKKMKEPQELDPETEEKMLALGYVAGTVKSTPETRKIDPKDKMHLTTAIQETSAALRKKQHGRALQLIKPILQEEPNMIEAHFMAGVAFSGVGEHERAAEEFSTALKLSPAHLRALHNLGRTYETLNQWQEAKGCYERVLQIDSNNWPAIGRLADLHLRRNEPDEARPYLVELVTWYEQALKRTEEPKTKSNLHTKLAEVHRQLNQLGFAEQNLKEAIQLTPKRPMLHYNLGLLYESKGNLPAALKQYEEEVAVAASNYFAYKRMGVMYRKFGRMDEAVQALQKAARLHPKDPETAILLRQTIEAAEK